MESLKKSMKWDEDAFGREYDLDIFMIVAVDSFNMGAMENKGLNIFNSAYVLADPKTATDSNFLGVEGVIAHEYFHNWTGNRITCRDWFQLTLKEGLTVYRDQEFSSDMNSRVVQRISDVNSLRTRQFVEDAGPTAHPIKPDSYLEVNNFYTSTVYEKGAEVIRMIRTFLGERGFRKGMDKYFELYDGMAVTTDEFLNAMENANPDIEIDFDQFRNWYKQAGTPEIKVEINHDVESGTLQLSIAQSCPATPGQAVKKPFLFPLGIGLVGADGKDLPLNLKAEGKRQNFLNRGILTIREPLETFVFQGVHTLPVVSLNRGLTAPIRVNAPLSVENLAFLLGSDPDEFNRYEASQQLSLRLLKGLIKDQQNGAGFKLHESFVTFD